MSKSHTQNIGNMVICVKFSKTVVIYFSYIEPSQGLILHPAAVCNIQQRQDVKWNIISEDFLLDLVTTTLPSIHILHKQIQNIIQLKYVPFPWMISEAHWSKTDMFANIVITCY